jgi:histidinol-phosphatase (PHP family)
VPDLFSSLADYHTHTPLCRHAEGWPAEYARVAVERGLGELGFADHNPMAEHFDSWRMLREELPRYVEAVEEARAAFPQLSIKLGLECDFIPGYERWIERLASMVQWDYLIGSVHYLPQGWEVDNPQFVGRHTGHAEEIWASYWKLYGQCIRSGLFDFVAHPDLPKKFGIRPEGDLRRYYEPAVAALAETGTPFEINTAGWRKECAEQYPARDFLVLAAAARVPLLINSDAHRPGEVGAGFAEAAALARETGFTHTLRFKQRQRSQVPIAKVRK